MCVCVHPSVQPIARLSVCPPEIHAFVSLSACIPGYAKAYGRAGEDGVGWCGWVG